MSAALGARTVADGSPPPVVPGDVVLEFAPARERRHDGFDARRRPARDRFAGRQRLRSGEAAARRVELHPAVPGEVDLDPGMRRADRHALEESRHRVCPAGTRQPGASGCRAGGAGSPSSSRSTGSSPAEPGEALDGRQALAGEVADVGVVLEVGRRLQVVDHRARDVVRVVRVLDLGKDVLEELLRVAALRDGTLGHREVLLADLRRVGGPGRTKTVDRERPVLFVAALPDQRGDRVGIAARAVDAGEELRVADVRDTDRRIERRRGLRRHDRRLRGSRSGRPGTSPPGDRSR